jgi:hypothetical protein
VSSRAAILCVGAVAALVGQGCFDNSRPALPLASPELQITPLDADSGAGGRPASAADGVRFAHPLPLVGGAWRVRVEATSRSEAQVSTYESEYTVEVLAVDGPAPSRARLRFLRNAHGFQGAETPTVIDGKEYVVDARAPHVRDAANDPAPEGEAQRVLDVFPDLGTRSRVDEVLPDGPMRVGERRDELAAAVLRVIHPRAWTLNAGSATLARVEREACVFALSLDASSDSGMRMRVSGEARVRLADARLEDLSLDGTYEVAKAGAETSGSFSLRRRITSGPERRSDR